MGTAMTSTAITSTAELLRRVRQDVRRPMAFLPPEVEELRKSVSAYRALFRATPFHEAAEAIEKRFPVPEPFISDDILDELRRREDEDKAGEARKP